MWRIFSIKVKKEHKQTEVVIIHNFNVNESLITAIVIHDENQMYGFEDSWAFIPARLIVVLLYSWPRAHARRLAPLMTDCHSRKSNGQSARTILFKRKSIVPRV